MEGFPHSFLNESKSVQLKIINLGQYCWSVLQSEIEAQKDLDQSALIKIWKEKGRQDGLKTKEEDIEKVKREYQYQIDESNRQTILVEKKLTKFEKELDDKVLKSEKQIQEKYIQELQKERDHILREAKVQVKEELSMLKEENIRLKSLQDYKQAFDFLHSQYMEKEKDIESLKTRIDDLTRVRTSYQLGKDGEGEIESLLKQLADFEHVNVHAEPDKADFRLTKGSVHMILDSKKYSGVVPKKERDKIIDNTDKDSLISGGILLSLNSKISARQHCEIELTKHNKPILYLCFVGMTQDAKLHCLDLSLKMLVRIIQSQNEKERNELVEKTKLALILLEEHRKKLENAKKALLEGVEHLKIGLTDVKQIMETLSIV
jgi:hypothetical protein